VRHSLRVKNNDPQSHTPRDGAGRRYGKEGGGRGGEGPWSRGRRGSPPRRLEKAEEREEAKDNVMKPRSAGRGQGRMHVDGGVDASVLVP
jgi:hypothetical protein